MDSCGKYTVVGLFIFVVGYGSGVVSMGYWQKPHGPVAAEGDLAESSMSQDAVVPSGLAVSSRQQARRQAPQSVSLQDSLFWQAGTMTPDPTLISVAVSQFSDEEVLDMITAYTHLAPHDLPEDVAVKEFAGRLAEIYYGDSFDRPGNPLDNPGFVGEMEFDVTKAAANRVPEPRDLFTATDKRIYASFETSGYDDRAVMVKWSRVDSPEVLIYDKYPIMVGMGHNYVWLEQPQGWEAGDYQVEIYSLADNLSLLARGSYGVD